MWLTNKILRYIEESYVLRGKMRKISARSLHSLVIIYEISQVSIYPFNKASYITSVTNISTCSIDNPLIYDFTINKLFWKGLRFDAKMRKISARSLRSLVIIYDKFLVPTLPIKALPPNHLTHGTPLPLH